MTTPHAQLAAQINAAFDERASLAPGNAPGDIVAAVDEAISLLDSGAARVAEKEADGQWHVNEWLKKAVLLSFRLNDNVPIPSGYTQFYDKVRSRVRAARCGTVSRRGRARRAAGP